jgi:hypothetical protein
MTESEFDSRIIYGMLISFLGVAMPIAGDIMISFTPILKIIGFFLSIVISVLFIRFFFTIVGHIWVKLEESS